MDFPTNFLGKFQDIVSQYPDRTAIVDMDGARSTTYRELGELSRRVAAKLCAQAKSGAVSGIDGRSVLVCMDRRMEYVAAEIGIMMAGAAYVPLIPEYPQDRVDYICKDCDAVCCIDAAWMEALGKAAGCEWDLEEGGYSKYNKNRALIVYTSVPPVCPRVSRTTMRGCLTVLCPLCRRLGMMIRPVLRRLPRCRLW